MKALRLLADPGDDTLNVKLGGRDLPLRPIPNRGPFRQLQGLSVVRFGRQFWHAIREPFGHRTRLALAVSGVLHLAGVSVLGLVEIVNHAPPESLEVEARIDPPSPAIPPLKTLDVTIDPVDRSGPGGSSVETANLAIATGGSRFSPPLALSDAPLETTGGLDGTGLNLTAIVASAGTAGGGSYGSGQGQGVGNGVGDGTGASFFGVAARGKSFVFVVDASSSMRRPSGGPERTLFNRLKLEILRSISQLSPEQKFYIIFFNDTFIPMPATSLVAATPEAQAYYLRWMAQMKAGGQTEPEDALRLALQLQPDVVYLLTDGEFRRGTVQRITALNRNRVAIHTVSFGAADDKNVTLRQIAEQNGGTFHFVPAAEPADGDSEGQDGSPEAAN